MSHTIDYTPKTNDAVARARLTTGDKRGAVAAERARAARQRGVHKQNLNARVRAERKILGCS